MGFGVPYHVCNQCFYKYYRLCQDFFVFEWMGGEVARSFEDSYLKWAEMTKTYECKQESARCLCSVLYLHAAIAFEPHIFVLCLYFTLAEAQQRKFRPLNLTSVHKHDSCV